MVFIKKQTYDQAPDIDPELDHITSDVLLVPDKDPTQTLPALGGDEGYTPGELVPSIFGETDQDKMRMALPEVADNSGASLTIQQLNNELLRTNLEWQDRIAEDTPKEGGLYGKSQTPDPLPKPGDESDSRLAFPDTTQLQNQDLLMSDEIPSMPPKEGIVYQNNPLTELRDVILNVQKQIFQGWDAMVKVFESSLRPITSGMFIAPDEEDLP